MLVLLSPAKRLDFESPADCLDATLPDLLDESEILIGTLRRMSKTRLGKLMGLSDSLAALNHERYQSFSTPFTVDNAKPAALAFQGDVYKGFGAETLSTDDQHFAQDHIRILSGLYGVLRPLDLIQPYRLEMGTQLKTKRGADLYRFWGDHITDQLNGTLATHKHDCVLNLASNEYFKSVRTKDLTAPVIKADFKDQKNGTYKIISFFAKYARGLMARWVVANQITTPTDLKAFAEEGYVYNPDLSTDTTYTFTRE